MTVLLIIFGLLAGVNLLHLIRAERQRRTHAGEEAFHPDDIDDLHPYDDDDHGHGELCDTFRDDLDGDCLDLPYGYHDDEADIDDYDDYRY